MSAPTAREPTIVVAESAAHLAVLATRALYEEQPDLWRLGEAGRARTLEDFTHHFNALRPLQVPAFERHAAYCVSLFRPRGFPLRWLTDAWRIMRTVAEADLPPDVVEALVPCLDAATAITTDADDDAAS